MGQAEQTEPQDKLWRMIWGLARQVAGPNYDAYLHDVAYWHFGVKSLRELTAEQKAKIANLLEFWEDKVADGRAEDGRVVAL